VLLLQCLFLISGLFKPAYSASYPLANVIRSPRPSGTTDPTGFLLAFRFLVDDISPHSRGFQQPLPLVRHGIILDCLGCCHIIPETHLVILHNRNLFLWWLGSSRSRCCIFCNLTRVAFCFQDCALLLHPLEGRNGMSSHGRRDGGEQIHPLSPFIRVFSCRWGLCPHDLITS
jgi:hypothetical protein